MAPTKGTLLRLPTRVLLACSANKWNSLQPPTCHTEKCKTKCCTLYKKIGQNERVVSLDKGTMVKLG